MNIADNPIFLTHRRLTHRSGVMAAVLIAGILGLCLMAGLVSNLSGPSMFGLSTAERSGKFFYGWVVGLEILVLVWGAFGRVSRALADDRKAGLWDSNRLTPLKASDLVTGYWFGTALREVYMGAVLAVLGLVMVLLARLPISLWLGTQVLIATTALFFGLLGVLVGMAFQRPQSGLLLLVAFVFSQSVALMQPKFLITNFLLPIYPIFNLFHTENESSIREWGGQPEFFGLPIHPVLLCVVLQFTVGWILWRSAVRKTVNPFQPLLQRREALGLFVLLMAVQHGLIWGMWQGHFTPMMEMGMNTYHSARFQERAMLPIVHGGTMLVGIIILAFASPQPESVRVEAMRTGRRSLGLVFTRSSVSLALAIGAVAAVSLLSQCLFSLEAAWPVYAAAIGNLLSLFLIMAMLLEYCRIRFNRRALSFVTLWLFVGCVLPFILALVFSSAYLGRYSLLAPGIAALNDTDRDELTSHLITVAAHFALAACLFVFWRMQWQRLLGKAAAPVA